MVISEIVRLCLVIDSSLTLNSSSDPRGIFVSQMSARILSLSFFFVRRAKRPRHANDHARDWRRETRLPPSFLASRRFAAQRSRARALPLLNLKKKRGCSQSTILAHAWRHFVQRKIGGKLKFLIAVIFLFFVTGFPLRTITDWWRSKQ